MRRTGNHAIWGWMSAQAERPFERLNNLEVGVNPYRYKYEVLRDYYPQYEWDINHYAPLARGEFTPKNWIFYSYEDYDLVQITCSEFERNHDLYLGKSRHRIDLLIMRDPFNLFASRFKSNMIPVKNARRTAVDLWVEYAREFLGETQILSQHKVCVNYNQWVQDRNYREHIAKQLGLPFTDAGVDQVSNFGGGSSFEGQSFSGKASQMPVFDRWQSFADDPTYRALLQDDRLLTYSEKIFGHIPGTERLTPSMATTGRS